MIQEQRGATRRGRPPVTDETRRAQRLHVSRHAVALFREQGVAATTGRQIADTAEISERTLWRMFRTKESCVEPLLTRAVESFQSMLADRPGDVALAEHLRARYTFVPPSAGSDVDAVLAVIRLTRDERALRAVWLVLQEQAEPTLAEVLGQHTGRPADDPEIRVRAAGLNAALRLITEDFAWSAADGIGPQDIDRQRERVAGAFRLSVQSTPHC